MADRDRQRVGGVRARELDPRQQETDHVLDLLLGGVADAHHRFLDRVRGVFADREPRLGRREQRDPARLSQLERADRVLVDEGLLDRRGLGGVLGDDRAQPAVKQREPRAKLARAGADHAVGQVRQPRPVGPDDAPAHVLQPGVDADDLHACPVFSDR